MVLTLLPPPGRSHHGSRPVYLPGQGVARPFARAVLASVGCVILVAITAVSGEAARLLQLEQSAYLAAPAPSYRAGTQTIGYSVAGRPITLTVVGKPTAARRAMFIGAIHGNERGGVPVTKALARSRPQADVAYFSISYPNPDGAVRNTRQNIRGVDLNRNFPGWRRNGSRGSVYYPGTGPLSERESRVVYNAIKKIRPTLFVTYHQHMNVIDFGGGNRAAVATYARQTRMRIVKLSSYPGSQATWLHAAHPRTTVMTVELPSRVSSAMVGRHLSAARYIAAHH